VALIGLVGCSRLKLAYPAPARRLYASPLFRLASSYCSARCDRWFVLSALYGLVDPDRVLRPYDLALRGLGRAGRDAWARRVLRQLRQRGLLHAGHRFLLLAGADYAEPLASLLGAEQPLRGLSVGRRLAWYRRALSASGAKEIPMEQALRLPALEVSQGGHTLFCFAVDGKRLDQFAAVSRIRRDGQGALLGYQRPEILRHIGQIRQYLETAGALLPNALVVAFDRRVRFSPSSQGDGYSRAGELTIPLGGTEEEKVGWLVDGQQRAAALREADVDVFPVCVVSFVADSTERQREQFLLVNSAKPLPRGLLYELLPQTEALLPRSLRPYRLPSLLLDRLNRDADSPLRGLVRTPTTPEGVIKDASLLRMLSNSLTNGGLFFFRGQEGEAEVEGMLRLLKDYWSAAASVFADAWGKPPRQSRLSGGPGVVALGFVMDAIIDRHRAAGLPRRAQFEADLERLRPVCRWTAGVWEFGPDQRRRWDQLQNTPREVQLLSNYLTQQYRALVWNGRGTGG
jgi:DGQHR domain-containing protein